MKVLREELAWAAGFYDGEGGLYFKQNQTKVRGLLLVIGQTDIRPLHRFQEAVGGLGKIYERSKPKSVKHKQAWVYCVGHFEVVQAVVAMMWPFMSAPKREQAVKALARYHETVANVHLARSYKVPRGTAKRKRTNANA